MSHRAVLFGAMATDTTHLSGVLDSADVQSSISAVRALGAHVDLERQDGGSLSGTITGWGERGPAALSGAEIDCGNSGTTARLLMGVLAPWNVSARLTGDESLCTRPMGRILKPLCEMGAWYERAATERETSAGIQCAGGALAGGAKGCAGAVAGGVKCASDEKPVTLPIVFHGTRNLKPITYKTPVASAQLKSAILLAGLNAHGKTRVEEHQASRDHTERMLASFGAFVKQGACWAEVSGPQKLEACNLFVPADPSSAAFLLCAAVLLRASHVCVEDISLNAGRCGFLRVLERMGARVKIESACAGGGAAGSRVSADAAAETSWQNAACEPYGNVSASYSEKLRATRVEAAEIPALIDEVPILALVAARAEGETVFCDVGELRVKESNRFDAIIEGLGKLGVRAWAAGDDLHIEGCPRTSRAASASASANATERNRPRASRAASPRTSRVASPRACAISEDTAAHTSPITFDSRADHRLAMTWAVAGITGFAGGVPIQIKNFDCVKISYPNFLEDINNLAQTQPD